MKIVEFAGRQYRIFVVASIHEENDYVECRALDTGDIVCELRIDASGGLRLLPASWEADAEVVAEAIAYAKEVSKGE
ncbi:hypothetical protein ACIA49_27585 [Kribbella sp. NPDC051587]|uniref:hypothetical protein n=1 Tax=Kribbella sp. NPDC051587 TaxID=3364119 RepID=UPI00378AD7B4